MNRINNRTFGVIATIASAVLFGCMPLFVKTILAGGGNTLTVTGLRFFLSLPALFFFLKWKKIPFTLTCKEIKQIFLLTLFGYGSTPLLLFASYNYIPSGMATTIHFCYPAFTILGCILFLKQKPQAQKLFCVALCMIGVFLFYNGSGNGSTAFPGLILAFISGITYSFYVIYLDASGLQSMNTFKLIFYMHLMASPIIFAASALTGNLTFHLSANAWLVMIFMSLSLCFISVSGFQIGVKYIGPANTTILSTFEPITSLIVGILVYHEPLSVRSIVGCIAILSATIIVGKSKEPGPPVQRVVCSRAITPCY